MRIAYIILAHKLPEQLVRLVCKLNTEGDSFLIHVDKKANQETYKKMSEPLNAFKNVWFLKRHTRYYGDYNHVGATLEGIHEIIASRIRFDYVILLTGQDYPIKPNEYIHQFLEVSGGKSFMEYFPLPSNEHWKDENGGLDRVNYWHFNFFARSLAFPKKGRFKKSFLDPIWSALSENFPPRRRIPLNYKLFGGSAYWCLSRECIEYLDKFVQENARFVRFFRHVLIPEESFFQTILLNSPFADRVVNDNLRYIDWSISRHPEILHIPDLEKLAQTHCLIARKFDISLDPDILNRMDQVALSVRDL